MKKQIICAILAVAAFGGHNSLGNWEKYCTNILSNILVENVEPNSVKICVQKSDDITITKTRLQNLKNQILPSANAEKLVETNRCTLYDSSNEAKNLSEIIKIISALEYPEISLFSECDCIDRRTRANLIEDVIIIKSKDKLEDSVYAGFGSGDLFPDLRMLTGIIKNKKLCAIHLSDPEYEEAINKLREKEISYTNTNCNTTCLTRILQLAFFAHLLSEIADYTIPVYVHKNVDAYTATCLANNKIKKANIATAIDYHIAFYGWEVDVRKAIIKTSKKIEEKTKEVLNTIENQIDNAFENALADGGVLCTLINISNEKDKTKVKETFKYKKISKYKPKKENPVQTIVEKIVRIFTEYPKTKLAKILKQENIDCLYLYDALDKLDEIEYNKLPEELLEELAELDDEKEGEPSDEEHYEFE